MSPEHMQLRLSGEVEDAIFVQLLTDLQHDPDWTVFPPFIAPPIWTFQLLHAPTAMLFTVLAEKLDSDTWRLA